MKRRATLTINLTDKQAHALKIMAGNGYEELCCAEVATAVDERALKNLEDAIERDFDMKYAHRETPRDG